MPWIRLALPCAALTLAGGLGCARPPGPPNILLVTLDTTRQDHCSAFGYARETTPFLEELAASGARFEAAYSASASTAPSHASLFTSLSPVQHLVVKNGVALDDAMVTLAETLGSRGYQTAGFVSSFVLERRFGFQQGFDVYDDAFPEETATIRHRVFDDQELAGGFDRPASATTERALEWVRSRPRDRPLFLFVHYFDAHGPHDPPEALRGRFLNKGSSKLEESIALYDAEILAVDLSLRRLVGGLRHHLDGKPLLCVIVGDHGEGLMDHGHMAHGLHVYEEQVRVPLVVHWPGRIPRGEVLRQPVEMVDLMPSILDLGGLPVDARLSGRSLAVPLLGEGDVLPRPVFLFRRHYDGGRLGPFTVRGVQLGVREGYWKYIVAPEEGTMELFDLEADPGERNNIVGARPDVASRLGSLVDRWKGTFGSGPEARPGISDSDDARLRALGYVR